MEDSHEITQSPSEQFPDHWRASTADSNLTLHGFRRFKTAHLLNLRYLEVEIIELDRQLYQAGLSLDMEVSPKDRLGLRHCKRDGNAPALDQVVSRENILRLRRLIKEYDEAIMSFNTIMSMDTFSLLDEEDSLGNHQTDPCPTILYKTRLLRTDQPPRLRQDPLQRWVHQLLRYLRYLRANRRSGDGERGVLPHRRPSPSQNTALIADILSRLIVAAVTVVFLTIPLAALSRESSQSTQIAVVAACVVSLAFLVSVTLRASNLEMMIVSAAYTAIISVFISNNSVAKEST